MDARRHNVILASWAAEVDKSQVEDQPGQLSKIMSQRVGEQVKASDNYN